MEAIIPIILSVIGFIVWIAKQAEKEAKQEVKNIKQAARDGDPYWQYRVGSQCMIDGDVDGAIRWWKKSAEGGNADAQYNLGSCYHTGEGLPQDEEKAIFWLEKAANQGLADAQFNLACAYCTITKGNDDIKTIKKAYYWFEKAAEHGDWEATSRFKEFKSMLEKEGINLNQNIEPSDIYACPHCGQHYEIERQYLGDSVTCQICNNSFIVMHNYRIRSCA